MSKRGRPTHSLIRQHLIDILAVVGKEYGYRLHKLHSELFSPCTRELIYYHLRKGVLLGEFILIEVKQEKGDYSWGESVEKRYYTLGENAVVREDLQGKIAEIRRQ